MGAALRLDGRAVGPGHPPYVIAELSGNHNGDLDRALAVLTAAAAAGATAVKLQTYTADTLTIDHDGPGFTLTSGLWAGRSLHELYREAHTPWAWHEALFAHGRSLGVTVFSSPFDVTALELLEGLGCPLYKIASPEIVDLGLIREVASTRKPMILSTGMASLREIAEAVDEARASGCEELLLLHCVSGYPTPPEEARLARIPHLAETFGCHVGISDHTLGIGVSIAAVAHGAVAVERHVTTARSDGGVDAAFSLEPEELAMLVRETDAARQARGTVSYDPTPSEAGSLGFRRSLYVVADVAMGELLTPANVRSIRPSLGLPPKHLPSVLGRRAARALMRGEPLAWSMVGAPAATE